MKSQKIKFDKNDYVFIKDVNPRLESYLLKRSFNIKSFKVGNDSSISISCWKNVDESTSLYISFYKNIKLENLFVDRKGREMNVPIIHHEGEGLFFQFNSLDDAQEFIKANYEII